MDLKRKSLLLEAIAGCSFWDDIHAKWAGFSKEDKGARFEDLTQAFLQVHETYAKEFVNIWRPDEVPAAIAKKLKLRVPEWGIDLVGETRSGEYWSIQCKYRQDSDQELTHNDISSSVATTFESSRGFSYLLVCTTTQRVTNHYDHNPKVLFYGLPIWQQIDAAFLDTLRSKLTGKKVALTPYSPRRHQINAIQDGLKHFKESKATRGKLIMPCGTGKSLTAWFLSQALGSKRVVIAVPSLSLVKQTLGVWTREAYHNNVAVDWICVCSDETAGRVEQDDTAIKVKDLGVPCLTSPDEIAGWLKKEHKGITVVFTTYQSGQVLATAARKAKYAFDLGIMDEAHKTVGDGDKLFSHLIHDHNIEIRRRVFMTATERRFSGSSDKILSMDDPEVYGETFHQLSFKQAMECQPPILCDYNVITIGVSRQEIKDLIKQNVFVRPTGGKWDEEMEADMLAAMVALRKAMKEHPIKHAVSFHGSIQRAELFKAHNDTFTQEFPEFGSLETFHVSGQTPTGTRSNIIKAFAQAERSLVTNARCLTEGVDVPGIDCVLFADPRKSTVDIVQAVGRALRPSEGKKLGYVILPVLHETDATFEQVIDSGAFKEILTTISALASNDDRIIEYFRGISQGRTPSGSSRVSFEWDERLAQNIDVAKLVHELEIKCWGRLAKLSWRQFEEAREFVRLLGLKSANDWYAYCQGKLERAGAKPDDIPTKPERAYVNTGWIGLGDWLGTGTIAPFRRKYRNFEQAREFARSLGLKSSTEWFEYCAGKITGLEKLPEDIPAAASRVYGKLGFNGFGDWLGTSKVANQSRSFIAYEEARQFVRMLGLKTQSDWVEYCKGKRTHLVQLPITIPRDPASTYTGKGWVSFGDWLGTGRQGNRYREFKPFEDARRFARSLGLKSYSEWRKYCSGKIQGIKSITQDIPTHPERAYANKGWKSFDDWLGLKPTKRITFAFLTFEKAKQLVHALGLSSRDNWRLYCKGLLTGVAPMPEVIPADPEKVYKGKGWKGMGDWLGNGNVAPRDMVFMPYKEAEAFAWSLKLKNQRQWQAFAKGAMPELPRRPADLPSCPARTYKGKGWSGWSNWLGNGAAPKRNKDS